MLGFSASARTECREMFPKHIFRSQELKGAGVIQRARRLAVWLCAALALAMAIPGSASAKTGNPGAAANATPTMLSAAGGAPFAIADFDGDQQPDLARVQAGRSNSYQTQYWIQLQLTRAGRQLIGIVAPIGGLHVTASDVNGDHAIDLVLSTKWLDRPVAILLNDGHGRFTAEKPSAFPRAFRQATGERLSHRQHPRGTVSAAQSRPSVDVGAESAQAVPRARARVHSNSAILVSSSHLLKQGRAPPSLL